MGGGNWGRDRPVEKKGLPESGVVQPLQKQLPVCMFCSCLLTSVSGLQY